MRHFHPRMPLVSSAGSLAQFTAIRRASSTKTIYLSLETAWCAGYPGMIERWRRYAEEPMIRLKFSTYVMFFTVAAIAISQFIASTAIAGNKCRTTDANCKYTVSGAKNSHGGR